MKKLIFALMMFSTAAQAQTEIDTIFCADKVRRYDDRTEYYTRLMDETSSIEEYDKIVTRLRHRKGVDVISTGTQSIAITGGRYDIIVSRIKQILGYRVVIALDKHKDDEEEAI